MDKEPFLSHAGYRYNQMASMSASMQETFKQVFDLVLFKDKWKATQLYTDDVKNI